MMKLKIFNGFHDKFMKYKKNDLKNNKSKSILMAVIICFIRISF